jgi:hypothetical protein
MSNANVVRKRAKTILTDGIDKHFLPFWVDSIASVQELNCHPAYNHEVQILQTLKLAQKYIKTGVEILAHFLKETSKSPYAYGVHIYPECVRSGFYDGTLLILILI